MCDASRVRVRQASGEALNYWPRRSARLIGIPAELDEQQNKSNGSIHAEDDEDEEENEEHEEEEEPVAVTDDVAAEDQCKNCKQRKTKQGRTLEALLIESQRFMHYPSKGSGCRMGRSTYNSRDIRPPQTSPQTSPSTQTSPPIEPAAPTPPLPVTVDQVQFSFEIVPTGTSWYQTFLRDEAHGSEPLPDDPPTAPAPFLLPYEMSLETILKSNRTVRKTNKTNKAKGTKKAAPLNFRPIISTRLQMQSAARQSQLAAAAAASESAASAKDNSKTTAGGSCSNNRHDRRQQQKPWFSMPRKSPRCHASTMAILCSKSDSDSEAVAKTIPAKEEEKTKVKSRLVEEPVPPTVKEIPSPDSYLVQVLEEVLTHGMEKRPANPGKKRGRPKKRTTSHTNEQPNTELVESSLTEMLATPLERIEDIVDERILPNQDDICMFNDDDDLPIVYPTEPWMTNGTDHALTEAPEVFHELDSHSGSRSSSVYETASEIGSTSTSTGTCDSRRKAWRAGNRRKRRNMTGWPRSKRRRPLPLSIIDVDEDLNLTGDLSCNGDDEDDDGPPILSPIREESTLVDASDPRPQSQPRTSSYVSKPFQFQRKTLRFVGKRILRPAAQRHAPQRLEYWPCFSTESSSSTSSGKRRKRKTS